MVVGEPGITEVKPIQCKQSCSWPKESVVRFYVVFGTKNGNATLELPGLELTGEEAREPGEN